MVCADKNERLNLLDNNCTESGETCFNTIGSFECRTPATITYGLFPSLAECPNGSEVSLEDCEAAGQSVGGIIFVGPLTIDNIPCGCWVVNGNIQFPGRIYFNTAPTSCAGNAFLNPVCNIN